MIKSVIFSPFNNEIFSFSLAYKYINYYYDFPFIYSQFWKFNAKMLAKKLRLQQL